jgi:hypothetical protein
MTIKQGRLGRKFHRAGMADPRGSWAAGVPASAGFYPEQGVRFSGTKDPLSCPQMPGCESADESGKRFSGTSTKRRRRGLRSKSRR